MSRDSNHAPGTMDKRIGVSEEIIFLHGDLEIWILEARSLPNMDLASERMRKCFTYLGSCTPFRKNNKHKGGHTMITSDPYVSVCLAGATVAQTRVIANCENPLWDEHFFIPVAHPVANVEFQVKDNDVLGAQLIGVVGISVDKILPGNMVDGWFPIVSSYGDSLKPYPELHLSLQFRPIGDNPLYKDGIGAGPDYMGVPKTYFPLRKGGNVTLYQDAHVPDAMLPEIQLDGGKFFQQGKCWEDICHAILEAHHLIYIIGWSIYHPVKLVREPTKPLPAGGELSLGDLLKYKSQEGVRVAMLIWDDKTSHDNFLLKTEGVMQTHDEETKKFFKHSSIHCVLSPRYASTKLSIFKQQVVGTLFTHHQKCVILDTQASGNNRKITAFIGGLDLCDGRYDTPGHRLFYDLDSVFANDVHNPTFLNNVQGPRQPWHDLHCKIEGPAAYDILKNFEQRWRKATKWRDFRLKRVGHWHDDALIKTDRISWILTPLPGPDGDSNVRVSSEEDPENWHAQVFRSIDSGSVKGFPKSVKDAEAQNLVCGKNLKIDKSIHVAYVKAIRSAQHFIYIENQYFLGSSYFWPSYKNAGADNLVPMELALKIASKINSNERFSVYIVIPLWPEGVPTSAAVQEILYWQGQTMAMMYKIVAQALEKASISNESHPQDYLNFYCLGKRETASPESSTQTNQFTENSTLHGGMKNAAKHCLASEISAKWHIKSRVACQAKSTQRTLFGPNTPRSIIALFLKRKLRLDASWLRLRKLIPPALSQKFRRFMIYVHAKGMIIDDEYVTLGSANINQRSLDGSRDTEIAMGAYQPNYTWMKKNGHPRGQVYGYRMSLWAEHLGILDESFREPQDLECIKRVNKIARRNWKSFVAEEYKEMKGHLMQYPIQVSRDGKVSPLPGYECFPDVGGKVLGAPNSLPDALTT